MYLPSEAEYRGRMVEAADKANEIADRAADSLARQASALASLAETFRNATKGDDGGVAFNIFVDNSTDFTR